MATKKPSNPQFTSPRGVFAYPSLDKPDFGNKEFPKPNGAYKVNLRLPEDVAEAWVESKLKAVIQRARDEAEAAFAKLPKATRMKLKELTWNDVYTVEYDKETEDATGFVIFKVDMTASGVREDKTKWSQKPTVFDSQGKRMDKVPAIWSGSEGKVSVEAAPYFIPGTGTGGVKLRLKAIQLLKLVSGSSKDASEYGFGQEDDGFNAADYVPPEAADSADDADASYGNADAEGAAGDPPDF